MTPTSTIDETLRRAAGALAAHSESPRLDAEVLLGQVLGVGRAALLVRGAETVNEETLQSYQALLARRREGAPVAYLTGTREFWSLPLKVTPAVLVPRPETEILVERALEILPRDEERAVVDLGTGSGAIALALAAERPRCRITGVDISASALAVARENSARLALPRLEWLLGSWFEAVPGRTFDLVIANPPYIAAGDDALERLTAEPALALTSGPTGLEALADIIAAAARYLRPSGWLLLEHGSGQGQAVAQLFARHGFGGIRSHDDFAGLPRVTLGTIHSSH